MSYISIDGTCLLGVTDDTCVFNCDDCAIAKNFEETKLRNSCSNCEFSYKNGIYFGCNFEKKYKNKPQILKVGLCLSWIKREVL